MNNTIKTLFTALSIITTSAHSMDSELAHHLGALSKLGKATPDRIADLRTAVTYITQHASRASNKAELDKKCAIYTTSLIPHLEREVQFSHLLKAELESPQKNRWSEIKPLLEWVNGYSLEVDAQLVDELRALSENTDKCYRIWKNVLKNFCERRAGLLHESEISAHPATTEITSQVSLIELTVPKKKKKKKKKSRQANHLSESQNDLDSFWACLIKKDLLSAESTLIQSSLTVQALNTVYYSQNCTPLTYAVKQQNVAMVKMLLRLNVDPNKLSPLEGSQSVQVSPLCTAILYGDTLFAEELLKSNANPNCGSKCSKTGITITPLTYAAQTLVHSNTAKTPILQKKLIHLLIKQGATEFAGKIIFIDYGSKSGLHLNMHKTIDMNVIRTCLYKSNGLDLICCHNGDIILLEHPLNDELEKIVLNRNCTTTHELVATVYNQAAKKARCLQISDEELSSTSQLSSLEELTDSSDCEVLDFNGLTLDSDE